MALYDILDEITERSITKSETGDERIYGVVLGLVTQNYDKDMPGRVCVTIPTRDNKANELQWARLAMPSGGKSWGHYFLPEVGDQVLLAFEGGNIERPYVIGCVQLDNNKMLSGSVDEKNRTKRIVTRHGSSITFGDHPDDNDGNKDTIEIATPGGAHRVLLDNENQKILISDKKKKCYFEMITKEGDDSLKIRMESSITLQVGDKIKMILNGSSGVVTIKADEVSIEGQRGITAKSSGSVKLEGQNLSATGTASFTAGSDSATKIKGATVSIG